MHSLTEFDKFYLMQWTRIDLIKCVIYTTHFEFMLLISILTICLTEVWIVVHAYNQLFIHSVILIECVLTLMWPSGHMTSILLSILERDPPLLLS